MTFPKSGCGRAEELRGKQVQVQSPGKIKQIPVFKVMAFAPAWSNITTTAEGKEKLNHSQKSRRWQVLASLIGVIKIMTSINIWFLISSVEQEKCNTCHFKLLCHVFIPSFPPGNSKILTKCTCTLQIFPEASGVCMFLGTSFSLCGSFLMTFRFSGWYILAAQSQKVMGISPCKSNTAFYVV